MSTTRKACEMRDVEVSFRELVDSSSPTLDEATLIAGNADLSVLYGHFALPAADKMSRKAVTDALRQRIRAALAPSNCDPTLDAWLLSRQMLIRHFAHEARISPYLPVLEAVRDALGSKHPRPLAITNQAAWQLAVQAALDFNELNQTFTAQLPILGRLHQRQVAVADAIVDLRNRGFSVEVDGSRGSLTDEEHARVIAELERQIAVLGGVRVAKRLFKDLRGCFDARQERYHHVRRPSIEGDRSAAPRLPLGMLVNLAMKHTQRRGANSDAAWEALLGVARSYAAGFDLTPYSHFESMFHVGETLPRFLQELAVFDSMYTLFQFRPSASSGTVRALFDWLTPKDEARLGYRAAEGAAVVDAVLVAAASHGPSVITLDDVSSAAAGVDVESLRTVLDDLAHDATKVNTAFDAATKQTAVDMWFRPLIRSGPDQFLLVDRHWCAAAFYEAFAAAARDRVGRRSDDEIGLAFERLVRAKLTEHGVAWHTGTYREHGVDGECDLVVETDSHILLIELKKKGLTRRARSGSDVGLLVDLTRSLVDAQLQLGQHERLLYEHGGFTLVNSDTSYYLDRAGREVERIAMTLIDYGALEDRMTLAQVLLTLVRTTIGTVSAAYKEQVERVQVRAKKLLQSLEALHALRPMNGNPFHNCWFLSYGHLLSVLDDTESNQSFKDSVFLTRHITMGSMDYYFERAQMKALKARAAKS